MAESKQMQWLNLIGSKWFTVKGCGGLFSVDVVAVDVVLSVRCHQ
jgi:hypothetical protein